MKENKRLLKYLGKVPSRYTRNFFCPVHQVLLPPTPPPKKKEKRRKLTEESFWVGIKFWKRAGVSSSLSLWKNKARSRGGVLLVLDFAACKLRYRRSLACSRTPFLLRSTLCSSRRSVVFIQCGSASNKSSGI